MKEKYSLTQISLPINKYGQRSLFMAGSNKCILRALFRNTDLTR